MAKKVRGAYKKDAYACDKCERTFSMPGHLVRHQNAAHGTGRKTKRVAKAGRGRRGTGRPAARAGRPKGITARLGLRDMTLEDLSQLIDAARDEARRRVAQLQKALE